MDNSGTDPIAGDSAVPDAPVMGELWAIVQAHIDKYGVREAELARRLGTSPQTLNSWKLRGVREMPSKKILRALAAVTGTDYLTITVAALVDSQRIERGEAETLRLGLRDAHPEAG